VDAAPGHHGKRRGVALRILALEQDSSQFASRAVIIMINYEHPPLCSWACAVRAQLCSRFVTCAFTFARTFISHNTCNLLIIREVGRFRRISSSSHTLPALSAASPG
jgi:hypothetical protein